MLYNSKTITFFAILGGIDAALVGMVLMEGVLSVKAFAITMLILKVVSGIGGVYYRSITTQPLSEK